ncbi:hypothetical protein KVQ82_23675 [Pseudomonas sp. AO-1]|uniref:hypothetical protein n=1 Tax=Pseudomonas sp. AO-1 TaxID=2855434 RepID=UPI001C79A064|nr:hypothetical protein [Pseudomonas sp. AO-1]QXZ13048.1 hypothetical protein KVQ82_23675 [Pseudomonas sp. AO-1]
MSETRMTESSKQEMQDDLENLRIEAQAMERLINFDPAQAISHYDMRARYARRG